MESTVKLEEIAPSTSNEEASASSVFCQLESQRQGQRTSNNEDVSVALDLQYRTHQISELTPDQDKWIIKARVTWKSRVLTWRNQRGQGIFFKISLIDESGEIRAVAFGSQLIAKYFDMIEVNNVYCFTGLNVQENKHRHLPSNTSKYELIFNLSTEVILCKEIPQISYDFIAISDVKNISPGNIVDIIGICVKATDIEDNIEEQTSYRFITLIDKSGETVTVLVEGLDAKKFNDLEYPVVAIKNGYVTTYNGENRIKVDCLRIDPDIRDAGILRQWFHMT